MSKKGLRRLSPEAKLARQEHRVDAGKKEIERLKRLLAQFESHRNRKLLRDLESTMNALEAVGTDGWPKNDEGHSTNRSSGSRGDKVAITSLVRLENALTNLNRAAEAWLEDRQDHPRFDISLDITLSAEVRWHRPVDMSRPKSDKVPLSTAT